MTKPMHVTSLLLLLSIHYSCAENIPTEKTKIEVDQGHSTSSKSLNFTSGIRAILQDSRGHYWLGSHAEGVAHFNGETFEYFTMNEGLADNQVRSLHEDQFGTIWIGTAQGVCSYDGEKMVIQAPDESAETPWMSADNDLWFSASIREGVYRHDGNRLTYLAFPVNQVNSTFSNYSLTSFSKGKDGRLWFGTYAGVIGYNGEQFTVYNNETLNRTEEAESVHVRSVFEDSRGRLWIGNNGIGVILKNGDSFIHFSKEQGKLLPMNEFEANALSNQYTKNTGLQSVFSIVEDSQGNIWFGDRDSGAWKYDGKTLENYKIDPNLNSQMSWCIYRDQANRLLFGMAEGGVYLWNGSGFEKQF
jgi:ligand-binding sensor domain-containing protein